VSVCVCSVTDDVGIVCVKPATAEDFAERLRRVDSRLENLCPDQRKAKGKRTVHKSSTVHQLSATQLYLSNHAQ